jgi:hypothetical protein
MARVQDKEKAIQLRNKGMSYSQIKQKLGINKSTLSGWLSSYPLSDERIRQLRDNNPQRIERCRNTKAKKKQTRLENVYEVVKKDIGRLSDRELFLAGLFLYWGEGYKTAATTTGLANTDPSMLRLFIKWLKIIKAPTEKIKVRIHIYSDMDKDKTIDYWKKELGLPKYCFGQVYVKKSQLVGLSYKNGFGHGTCNIVIYNRDLAEYVIAGLRYFREELSNL